MDSNYTAQLYRVLKKYYIMGMNQKEVAKSENLSNATVSRMISKAVSSGYVNITLNLPVLTVFELEQEIKEKFNLEYVSVTHVDIRDYNMIARDVSLTAADYLNQVIQDNDIIGVSWGNTLSKVAGYLKPKTVSNISVVELNGGISKNINSTGAETIILQFARNYNGIGYILPMPSFVDNSHIAEAIMGDSQIKAVFELINRARIIMFSVGNISEDSVLIQSGYFSRLDYDRLRKQAYVGDICSRYIKRDGTHLNDELYRRVIGVSLEEIKKKEHRICVIMDEHKAEGLYGALAGGYITALFLDEGSARALLSVKP